MFCTQYIWHCDAILKKKTEQEIQDDSTIFNVTTHGEKFLANCNNFERRQIKEIIQQHQLTILDTGNGTEHCVKVRVWG